ncbi:MAG: alkaline phosphatase D family protein, partial [Hyphomicrobium sp.]
MTGSDDRQPPAASSQVVHSRAVTLALLAIPVAMIAAGLALLVPSLVRGLAISNPIAAPGAARNAAGGLSLADAVRMATPATPWRNLARDSVLTRIGFGSCLHQSYPQPIWTAVAVSKPQLFLMMGDNVYGDIRSGDGRELAEAYRRQLANPEFSAVRAALPMLGTWDDHDYGLNDAAAGFPHRATAAALFRAYWQRPAPTAPPDGIYSAHMFGPAGRRVQIIMLDTRSFRSAFAPKPDGLELFGKFGPDRDPSKTMLGAAQWAWLEAELRKPAEVRLLVSSIQVLSDG